MPCEREAFKRRQTERKAALQRDAAVIWMLHKNPLSRLESIQRNLPYSEDERRRMEKSVKYDILPFLIRREIVKEFKEGNVTLYALSDYEDEDARVLRIMRSFELLWGRWPSEQEIGSLTGMTPKKARSAIYKVAPIIGWKPPSEMDNAANRARATRRLELAAWLKLECGQASFVKHEWPDEEEHAKAKLVVKEYPDYVPKISMFKIRGDIRNRGNGNFYYTLTFPKKAVEIVGISATEERMVSSHDFSACFRRLKIEERAY